MKSILLQGEKDFCFRILTDLELIHILIKINKVKGGHKDKKRF